MQFAYNSLIFTAYSERRKVSFLASLVCVFICLCMKYLGNRWTDFAKVTCLVPRLDEFESQGERLRSPGTKKRHFFGPFSSLHAVHVW